MWRAVTAFFALLAAAATSGERCDVARMKCAYRVGCGKALHAYVVNCADVIMGRTSNRCPKMCQRALIGLTSTDEGQALVDCDCGEDEFCSSSKERIEVCRPEVTQATAFGTIVSCSVARWICEADPVCSTALDFYHRLCRGMFHGRRCTPRCNNSLTILDKQEKAAKLRTCKCDGSEEFPCQRIRDNMDRLCFGREPYEENEIDVLPSGTTNLLNKRYHVLVVYCLWMLSILVTWTRTRNILWS